MKINDLQTPAILVYSQSFMSNIKKYQRECDKYSKQLWPMVKTHKSTVMADLQTEEGATGFLCGTLDECEILCDNGSKTIMYAYPVAGKVSCNRVVQLAKKCDFYVRLDTLSGAEELNEIAKEHNVVVKYTIILDCGFHRFGIVPEEIAQFATEMKSYENLKFCGISTHCGHVYGEADAANIPSYAKAEVAAIHLALDNLKAAGFECELVTTGSTPTFWGAESDERINVYHPGNYVFNDCIQLSNHTATEEECSLVVYATIISQPKKDMFICDAGAKCLGLDLGAHGNTSIKGHGKVIDHPELYIYALSEEVGKIHIEGETTLKVGDRIKIIPNHSCSSANLTNYFIMVDNADNVEKVVPVDIRGNCTLKGIV